jgi:transposase
MGWYDQTVRRVRDLSCGDTRVFVEFSVRRVSCRGCGKVKRERLAFLADNPLYTKRFAYFVGRRCRQATITDVAKELTGQAIYGGAAGSRGQAGAQGHRHRRNLDS